MTELSYYSPNPLILPSSRFFNERLKNVNEEIKSILTRVDTHVPRESLAVSSSPLAMKPEGAASSSTGKCLHQSPSPFPARTIDGGSLSFPSCIIPHTSHHLSADCGETASVPLSGECVESVSTSPQVGSDQETIRRIEFSKWMEQHLPSYIVPILNNMLKTTVSTSSLPIFPLSCSGSSSSCFQKEVSALHCHLLEVEESFHGVIHDLDDAKLKWLDQHRQLQSATLGLERELKEAVRGVYHEVEEKMSGARMTLNEVHHQKCFEMQAKMEEMCDGIQKGWAASLHQYQAETRAKMVNIEGEVKTWRREVMTSLHQELEPFHGLLSECQQQLERVQTELARAMKTINEQNLAIQLLRDERILHRSEMRGCKRDFQRLEFVLHHFFTLHSTFSSLPKEFSFSSSDNSHHSSTEFAAGSDSSSLDVPSALLYDAEKEHNGERDGNGSPFQQYTTSHAEKKDLEENVATDGLEKRKEKKHGLPSREGQPARWKNRLKFLQKQVNAMKKRCCCHCHIPCSLGCSPVDTAPFYAWHQPDFPLHSSSLQVPSTVLPSSPPGNVCTVGTSPAMSLKGVESVQYPFCVAHPLGFQSLSGSKEKLRQWNAENILENQKEVRLASCTPRARGENERKEANIDVIELSALDACSFMGLSNEVAYPPPLTSDSESDRDNHHLSRLALD